MNLISPNFKDLLTPNFQIGQYPDGETHILIPNAKEFSGQHVTIFHRLYPHQNDSIVELLMVLECLKEKNCSVTVVAPYLPYARQDSEKTAGQLMNAKYICNMLHHAGCSKLITFDCHFLNSVGQMVFGELTIENLSLGDDLVAYAKNFFQDEDFEIVAPDKGANYLVSHLGGRHYHKTRDEHLVEMSGEINLEGKNVFVVDDMISTGGTMLKALEKIKTAGAKKIACGSVHGLFLGNSLRRIQELTDVVFSTDTIPNSVAKVPIANKIKKL